MPFQIGSVAVHDDGQHFGSSKRDVALGVAGLNATGDLVVPSSAAYFVRNISNDVQIRERTSGEDIMYWRRSGVSDYAGRVMSGGVVSVIQLANMKDVASGIAGLDAAAEITSRLAYENVASGVAGLDVSTKLLDSQMPGLLNQYLKTSTVLHTHNGVIDTTSAAYVKLRTITINTLINSPATMRIAQSIQSPDGATLVYTRIYKNGAAFGPEQSRSLASIVTYLEDLVFAQGDTIELWAHSDGTAICRCDIFEIRGETALQTLVGAIKTGDVTATPCVGTNS